MISLVILNWNSGPFLARVLASIEGQTSRNHELIVVDNASTNDSLDVIREFVRRGVVTTFVQLGENRGFAGGMNAGIECAKGDYVIPLNSDACLAPNFVETIERWHAERAATSPTVGMLAVRLYDWDFSEDTDVLTERVQVEGVTLMRRLAICPWTSGTDPETALLGPSGSVPIISRAALDAAVALSGFAYDPSYFAYVEDVDLFIRLQSIGFSCEVLPGTRVWHIGSGSQEQNRNLHHKPMRLQRLAHMNKWRTWRKIGSARTRLEMLPWMIVDDLLRIVHGPARRELAGHYWRNLSSLRTTGSQRYPETPLQFGGTLFSRSIWRETARRWRRRLAPARSYRQGTTP